MIPQFFIDRKLHNGLNYKQYIELTEKQISETDDSKLSAEEKEIFEYTKLNLQRSSRIDRHYSVSDELSAKLNEIDKPQALMVITENWCGDSAQNLPYLTKMAEVNSNVDLKILLRDEHPEIMDLYLTNGTKSIPVLVIFDEDGNELFKWGPRPKLAQQLINQWKSEGIVKPELYEKLHLWYGRNRGKEIENEMLELINNNYEVLSGN